MIGTLGIDEPERNGYHYLRDLTTLLAARGRGDDARPPRSLCRWLERPTGARHRPTAAIQLGSVVAAPFGVGWPCDIEEELPSAESLLPSLDAEPVEP